MVHSIGAAGADWGVSGWERETRIEETAQEPHGQTTEPESDTTGVKDLAADTVGLKRLEQQAELLRYALEEKLERGGADVQPEPPSPAETQSDTLSAFDAQVQGDIERAIETDGTDPIIEAVTDMMPGFSAEPSGQPLTWRLQNGEETYTLQIRDAKLTLSTDGGKSVWSPLPARLDRGNGATTNFNLIRAKLRNLHVRLRAL